MATKRNARPGARRAAVCAVTAAALALGVPGAAFAAPDSPRDAGASAQTRAVAAPEALAGVRAANASQVSTSLADYSLELGFYANASSEYTGYRKNLVGTLRMQAQGGAVEVPASEYDLVIYRDAACAGDPVDAKDFKNVGTYYAKAMAKAGSAYSGESAPARIDITKKLVPIPERQLNSDGSNLRYNGNEQVGVAGAGGADAAFYTVEGTESATLPGTYTATYKLKDPANSEWKNDLSGNSAADKAVTWTLDKAWLVTVTPKSGTIPIGASNARETITYSYHGTGDITVESSDESVVRVVDVDEYSPGGTADDVTHSGKIHIEGLKTGEATITVKVGMDDAYANRYQNRVVEVRASVDFTEAPSVKVPDAANYVYDGLSHVGAEATSQYVSLSGILEATNVGTYVVFADLLGNAQWADTSIEGTRAQVTWEITPAYLTNFTLVATNAGSLVEGASAAPTWQLLAPGATKQTVKSSDFMVKYYADANGNREIAWDAASRAAGTYYARAVAQGSNCKNATAFFPVTVREAPAPSPGGDTGGNTGGNAGGAGNAPDVAADKAAAAAVDAAIAAIGEVTLESEGAITHARRAYDALTDAQRGYVDKYPDLVNAEKALADLKAHKPSDPVQMPAFNDVGLGAGETPHWVVQSGHLERAVSMGIMQGWKNADGTWSFGPDRAITRAEVATMLWRHACPDEYASYVMSAAKNSTDFVDAPDATFYTAALNWAYEAGIMTGSRDDSGALLARPTSSITREEAAALLARYAKLCGADTAASAAYSAAPDAQSVSSWARTSVGWCYERGIMTGMGDTRELVPQGSATRAEMCKMAVELTGLLSNAK